MLSSELFDFLRYLYRSEDTQKFCYFGFFEVHAYLKTYSNFYAEFRSIGIFEIYFTIQKISVKAFTIF